MTTSKGLPTGVISAALLVLLGLTIAGCGGKADGPEKFSVSGTVKFDGKPVPQGFITFRPDTSKGNKGPGSGAAIENGEYDTPAGKGVVGGPHIVEIRGSDGVPYTEEGEEVPGGKQLFPPYETTFDFPKENTEKNFEVPKPAE